MLKACRDLVVVAGVLLAVTVCVGGCPSTGQPVFFGDINLEHAIRAELHQPFGLLMDSDLKQLLTLDAGGKGIRDLSGLERCTNLTWLNLDTNTISDLTPLTNLTNLMVLDLDGNEVSDLSPLAGMLHLDAVSLRRNQVSDIQALVTNAVNGGLGEGDVVALDGASLSEAAKATQVPALQALGVNVDLGTVTDTQP